MDFGHQFGDDRAAEAALAGAHAGAQEGFGLVRALRASAGDGADGAGGDFFAAADRDVIGRGGDPGWRGEQAVEEGADGKVGGEVAALGGGQAVARGGVEGADAMEDFGGGDAALMLGGTGAADAAAVAGDQDVRLGGVAERVGAWAEAVLDRVPVMRAAERAGDLLGGDDAFVQSDDAGAEPERAAAAGEGDVGDFGGALQGDVGDVLEHRHALALEGGFERETFP